MPYGRIVARTIALLRPVSGRIRAVPLYYRELTAVEKPNQTTLAARRYFVRGRVQGVGFRYFVERVAAQLNLTGYARNLDDGRVEVYAAGNPERLSELAGFLWTGPRWADVRGVEEREAPVLQYMGFRIE